MMGGYGGWGSMGLFAGVFMLLILIAIVLVIGWLLWALVPQTRWGRRETPHRRESAPEPAIEVVKRRYAAGEISRAEFMQIRRTLGHGAAAGDEMGYDGGE